MAWRLALRDLRGGLKGLRLLILCIFLGVAGLAGVGSLGEAMIAELGNRGQEILGGDIQMQVAQRTASPDERAAFRALGDVSETIKMRAMASTPDSTNSVLAELKSIDRAWPLYGRFSLAPGALAARPSGNDVAIAPALAERLRLKVGDHIRLGAADFRIIGVIANEPDRVGEGFALGPTILIDGKGMSKTALVQPGSLYTSRYRIRLPAYEDVRGVADMLDNRFHDANWEVSDRTNAARGLRRFVDQLGQFLTLVGLTALAVAGIGVGNGVGSWLDQRRNSIATLKILGASSATIFRVYLIQIAIVTAAAIVTGLTTGAAFPALLGWIAGDALPVQPHVAIFPLPLAVSAIYGMMAALLFSIVPLSRAGRISPAAILRARVDPLQRPGWRVVMTMAVALASIVVLAVATSRNPALSAGVLGGVALVLLLLALVGRGIRTLAAKIPHPRRPLLRLALANLHRPGSQTDRLVVALGLGLTLFVALAVIQSNLAGQIERTVPARAPNFFVLDIPANELDRFSGIVRSAAPQATIRAVPSLRGSVTAVRGTRVADMRPLPNGAWILNGDRGLTYATKIPDGNELIAGKWWPADYAGPPLISIEDRAAEALQLKPGDSMTIAVLGVEIEARIASIRRVNWETMGFNFGIVFAPGALEGAPHTYMATIAMPDDREAKVNRAVVSAFPSVALIRVKDVVSQVTSIFGQLAMAIRAAASVALAAGIAVLVGAIAASQRARSYDAVLLKMLGATRWQILTAQAVEYALLASFVAALAFLTGTISGWYIVRHVFELAWSPDWTSVSTTLLVGSVGTLGIGLIGSVRSLSARPAQLLRDL